MSTYNLCDDPAGRLVVGSFNVPDLSQYGPQGQQLTVFDGNGVLQGSMVFISDPLIAQISGLLRGRTLSASQATALTALVKATEVVS